MDRSEAEAASLARLSRSNERLQILSAAANELLLQASTLEAVPRAFEPLSAHLGLEVFLLHVALPDGTLALGPHGGIPEAVLDELARAPEQVFARAAARRAPLVVQDVPRAEEPLPALRLLQVGAFAVFPLLAGERLIGTLAFGTRQRAWFEPDELSALEITADQVAMALDRERLVEELKRRADDLAAVDRRKDEFLAMLAHELRNPLASILNAVEILRQEGTPAAVARRALHAADRQVRHLSRLVGDLVDVSRVRTGKVELRRESVDLARVVEDAVSAIEPLAHEQRQEVAVELPAGPLLVDGDSVRLTQVVENLLHNAVKYTDPGGHVRLTVAEDEQGIRIRVSDDGQGIGPDLLPRVFDTFVQGEQPSNRARGGLGLGLTLVKSLVELHRGTVSAASAGPGRGSTFEVRLPAEVRLARGGAAPEDAGGDREQSNGAPPAAAATLRVAIIEDNPDIRETLRELLRLRGHEVVEAEDGPGGVQLVLSRNPDVALVDIGLPGIDGYEVAARLRGAGHTRLVALTGYGSEEDRTRAVQAGFDAHLVKPVDFQDLTRLLESLSAREPGVLLEGAAPTGR